MLINYESETDWSANKMVGFYNDNVMPIQLTASNPEEELIKRLVCSPDLPITRYPAGPPMVPPGAMVPAPQQQATAASAMAEQCTLCSKSFVSKSSLQVHQRTHHQIHLHHQQHSPSTQQQQQQQKDHADDPYRCNICAKTFAVPARLTRHYRTHTGEKPFRCEFCNKSFSVKENLSVHRRIHTKERPYKCEVCARAFEHSGKLHRHMRIHTGERPHKCSVCAKTFIQSGQLVIHMRTHTGEKPYVCAVCQKGFTCSKQLKVHSRTHTGEKPYSCEICGKSFGYNHVLKLHQVAHYGEKVYKCTICNDTFNSKKTMEAHIKSHAEQTISIETPPPQSSSPANSDKENHGDAGGVAAPLNLKQMPIEPAPINYDQDVRYYLCSREPTFTNYPASGVELLAAAASSRERIVEEAGVLNLISRHPPTSYFNMPPSGMMHYDSNAPLNAGDDIRRRVEAALAGAEPMLTPPSSNPVSPAPSLSPDPELSLPPRKRSKMILRSMEDDLANAAVPKDLSPVRHSSVIQYARAS